MLAVVPGPALTSLTLTADAGPIAAAGGLAQPVVGFLQAGTTRLYVPVLSIALVGVGELLAARSGRAGLPLALLAGVAAGAQLIVVSGCGCGDGSAGVAMTLAEQALAIV